MTPKQRKRYDTLVRFGLTPDQAREAVGAEPAAAPAAPAVAKAPSPPPAPARQLAPVRRLYVPPMDLAAAPRAPIVRRTVLAPPASTRPPGGFVSITSRMDDPVTALRTTGGGPIR